MSSDLYTLPIAARPAHPTPLRNRLLCFPIFVSGILLIISVQACFVPVGVVSAVRKALTRWLGGDDHADTWLEAVYEWGVKRTKQMFGMLRESHSRC